MIHTDLKDYYETIHGMHHHKYSVADLENMFPFERDLISDMIMRDQRDAATSPGSVSMTEAPTD